VRNLYVDAANPNLFHDDIPVIDDELTQPWTAHKPTAATPIRARSGFEYVCAEGQQLVPSATKATC
jgi:hypothetical protein